MNLTHRPRRLRRTPAIRNLVQETRLHPSNLIAPLFVVEGRSQRQPIETMPGQFRFSMDELERECSELLRVGVSTVNLFGYCSQKDDQASQAYSPEGIIPQTIRFLKQKLPELSIQTDVALDPYTSHGHDGIVRHGEVINDETVEVLCRMALAHADAGADWVAPSDMMDGRVGQIREALDAANHTEVCILSYSAKYASAFYGPFRGALNSAPQFGDKRGYQMNPANQREALREMELDVMEGADAIMVKPALAYLDIIRQARDTFQIPIAAYNVSGEYAMIVAAAEKGWIRREPAILETLLSIKRAGADLILTYFAKEAALLLGSA